jgi:hypothetical protein
MVHVGVRVPMAGLCAVSMGVMGYFDRHQRQAAVADTTLSDDVLCAMLNVGSATFKNNHFHATFVIKMDVQRRMRQIMMLVKCPHEPPREVTRRVIVNVDKRSDTIPAFPGILFCLLYSGPRQVSYCFREVLIATQIDNSVEIDHRIVVESDGDSLHGK